MASQAPKTRCGTGGPSCTQADSSGCVWSNPLSPLPYLPLELGIYCVEIKQQLIPRLLQPAHAIWKEIYGSYLRLLFFKLGGRQHIFEKLVINSGMPLLLRLRCLLFQGIGFLTAWMVLVLVLLFRKSTPPSVSHSFTSPLRRDQVTAISFSSFSRFCFVRYITTINFHFPHMMRLLWKGWKFSELSSPLSPGALVCITYPRGVWHWIIGITQSPTASTTCSCQIFLPVLILLFTFCIVQHIFLIFLFSCSLLTSELPSFVLYPFPYIISSSVKSLAWTDATGQCTPFKHTVVMVVLFLYKQQLLFIHQKFSFDHRLKVSLYSHSLNIMFFPILSYRYFAIGQPLGIQISSLNSIYACCHLPYFLFFFTFLPFTCHFSPMNYFVEFHRLAFQET